MPVPYRYAAGRPLSNLGYSILVLLVVLLLSPNAYFSFTLSTHLGAVRT